MAHSTSLYFLLGFLAWGDMNGLTWYRSKRGATVIIPKTHPAKPPSPDQQTQRQAFAAAKDAWLALTPAQRLQWHLAADRASLCMHGYDLFMHWSLIGDDKAIETIERQTETTLLP